MNEFNEITSLNSEDLDVEELERRLELAATVGDPIGVCGWCGVDCPKLECGAKINPAK